MSEIARRIRTRREQLQLSQEELAKRMGYKSRSSINKIESGENDIPQSKIEAFAKALHTTPAYLMGWTDQVSPVYSLPGIEPLPKTKKVPRLGTIACGEPILAVENIECYDKAPETLDCDYTLLCKGDSMTGARIMDGDIVYIRQQEDVDNGEIAAVLIGDDVTLKRVRRTDTQLILWPENPAYSPMIFSGPQLSEVRIIGKAVAFLSRVK